MESSHLCFGTSQSPLRPLCKPLYLDLHKCLLKLDTGIGGQQGLLIYELLSSP